MQSNVPRGRAVTHRHFGDEQKSGLDTSGQTQAEQPSRLTRRRPLTSRSVIAVSWHEYPVDSHHGHPEYGVLSFTS